MSQARKTKVLVLGASSWLGYLLIHNLKEQNIIVGGTYFNSKISFGSDVFLFQPLDLEDYKVLLKEFQPTVIVNFLRGENNYGMAIHQEIIDYAEITAAQYIYASSVLALDGHPYQTPLLESILANGISPYGQFKAACERKLYDSSLDWCILRFASVQGWVPHKKTRNESFLSKLKQGQTITVDEGVLQNRMFANLLINGVTEVIQNRVTGIIHFGTTDASEEIEFLQKQAELFGYPPSLVKKGKPRKINLVAIPQRIYSLFGSKYLCTEEDTLHSLYQLKELNIYFNLKKTDHVSKNS